MNDLKSETLGAGLFAGQMFCGNTEGLNRRQVLLFNQFFL